MQISSKLLFRMAVLLLGVMLAAAFMVVIVNSQKAAALSSSQWDTVRNAVKGYIASQVVYSNDGEAGFTINRATLKSRIDSNGDMSPTGTVGPTAVTGVLGEGDDAAGAPVLIDNLFTTANVIPGSSVRCNWSGSYGSANCFDSAKVTEIAGRVNAHEAAGFSTDIVLYCATGRTESVTVGGLGPLAQTGALGGTTSPRVLAYKWGRNGWTGTTTTTSSGTGATGAGTAPGAWVGYDSNPTPCNSYTSAQDVVRCAAQWAVVSGAGDAAWGGNGYNHGNGITTAPTTLQQVIDIRTPSPATTMQVTGAPTTRKIPVEHLFDSQLGYMTLGTSTAKNVILGRTMHLPLIVSTGAVMLGYDSTAYVWGVNSWNTSLGGESYQTGGLDTPTYPTQTAAGSNQTSAIDQTAPTISGGPTVSNITTTGADISRTTSEPATSKIALVGSDGHVVNVNNTILNASKTVSLAGLHEGVTYTGTLTAYDGQANGTSAAVSFATTCSVGKPALSLGAPGPFWASYADYTAKKLSVTWTVTNSGTNKAYNVAITSSTATYAPISTITAMPASIGDIAAGGGTGSVVIQYQLPANFAGSGFRVINTASAGDCAGNSYTYP